GLVYHLGQPREVSVVQDKTPRGTRGVLAQVPLGPAACFPTYDDLLTLTLWTPAGDERHETLLVSGRCQEWAQCDINLSPSPHREHYPKMERKPAGYAALPLHTRCVDNAAVAK